MKHDSSPPTATALREIVDTGPTLQLATHEESEPDMAMPPDQQLAWEMVDGFRAHYAKLHHRQPRRAIVTKFFNRFLAKIRAAS